MGFSLWNLFKAGLLVTNSVAILHRGRFLRPMGFAEPDPMQSAGSVKNQVVGLVAAFSYLRGPLLLLNLVMIVLELLFGG